MPDELDRQMRDLEAERHRPVPPITDPPGVGRARLRELADALDDDGLDR